MYVHDKVPSISSSHFSRLKKIKVLHDICSHYRRKYSNVQTCTSQELWPNDHHSLDQPLRNSPPKKKCVCVCVCVGEGRKMCA